MVKKPLVSRYVWRSSVRPQRTAATAKYSNMKAFAHLSPTVPAIFVAAMGIALSVFLLSGARVQGEPTPSLAEIGGAAGRVVADLPATVANTAPRSPFARSPPPRSSPLRRPRMCAAAAASSHQRRTQVHRRARIGSHGARLPLFRHAGTTGLSVSSATTQRARRAATATAVGRSRPPTRRRPVPTGTERRSGTRASTTTDSHADTRSRRRPRHRLRPLRLRR